MGLLLLALVLSSDFPSAVPLPDADLEGALVAPPSVGDGQGVARHALWLQPIGLTVAPIATTAAGLGTYVALPLGGIVSFESAQLSFEATGAYFTSSGSRFVTGYASVGPLFHTGDAALGGFFLTPKLGFDIIHELTRRRTGMAFMVGLDGGWQRAFGRFYLGLVLGVSAGWSFADNDWLQGSAIGGPPGFGTDRARPVLGVNVNLLRIGFAL